ncbi:helix-turn-helix domain-containing protein [Dyadobacter subterraneus]|uniref:Helix-turn-helix transcriptional regulator n=1 Tax=Dyadobacter subterraneus TaxID=2773304 RepID=A0ABR9WDP5_9BACT|nr:helix-turn-helix domain-containing protein [Dyadobacter subterraneus]MBE9463618.1 helix-turn-helix transcriptional regulator [Dyadobacter subterraneus]
MSTFLHLKSIADLFRFFRLERAVMHPLVAVIDFSKVREDITEKTLLSCDFYSLICKSYNRNNFKYGRKVVDFQDGSLICMAPNQVLELENDSEPDAALTGWGLFFHPDLIRATSVFEKMKDYSFFAYEVAEALHLSDKENQILKDCVAKIETELKENIDEHSQNIIVSQIELVLNYCTRFYSRQFITRKNSNNGVVMQVEKILSTYFQDNTEKRLPTVKDLAEQVFLSPGYLSDLLKKETGKSAQDHIHFYLIDEAKNLLLSTDKTVSEIAYILGFEYSQYFNKLFKQKTGKTPVEFRN